VGYRLVSDWELVVSIKEGDVVVGYSGAGEEGKMGAGEGELSLEHPE